MGYSYLKIFSKIYAMFVVKQLIVKDKQTNNKKD